MKSKPFARRLKNLKVGFRYFRIWGNPLQPHNVPYHLSKPDSDAVVFEHPVFGWMTLYVLEATVLNRPYIGRCGSLDNRFFSKRAAALRVLEDYKALRTDLGLADMCEFHREMDLLDRYVFAEYNDYHFEEVSP